MIVPLIALIAFLNAPGRAPALPELRDAHRQTLAVSAALQRHMTPDQQLVDSLERSLQSIDRLDSSQLPFLLTSRTTWRNDLAHLSLWYQIFRAAYNGQCGPDSLRAEFHRFSTSFHFIFCDFFLAEIREQRKAALLLFAPSISCECTMQMSGEYELLLDSIATESGGRIPVIIIDTFFRQDLSSAHTIPDAPAILLLDPEGREVHRWVTEGGVGEDVRTAVRAVF